MRKASLSIFRILVIGLAIVVTVLTICAAAQLLLPHIILNISNVSSSSTPIKAATTSKVETISATSQTLKSRLDLGHVILYENMTDFIIEIKGTDISSGDLSFSISSNSNHIIYLHALGLSKGNEVAARYAYVNRTYAKLVFSLDTLMERVRKYNISDMFKIGLPKASKVCYINLHKEAGLLDFKYCEDVVFSPPSFLPHKDYPTFYDVVLRTFNDSTMSLLRKTVFGGSPPSDVRWAVWNVLAWVDENINYDELKALSPSLSGIYDPLTTIRRGEGICSDYAILSSAILLSVNVNSTYLLEFNTSVGPHAIAGVELDGILWVLDQHLPVIEWDDYKQYVANITSPVYVYRISYDSKRGPFVEFYKMNRDYIDTYPADAISEDSVNTIMDIVSKATGMRQSKELSTVVDFLGVGWKLSLPTLTENTQIPLDVAYSPLFKEQWSAWLAKYLIGEFNVNSLGNLEDSFWVTISRTEGYTTIKMYAVPFTVPRITHSINLDSLHIQIDLYFPFDPVKDVLIFIYALNTNTYCGAVAPPNYRYEGIPYVNADVWEDNLTIVVGLRKIYSLKSYCGGTTYVAVVIKQDCVYAIRI